MPTRYTPRCWPGLVLKVMKETFSVRRRRPRGCLQWRRQRVETITQKREATLLARRSSCRFEVNELHAMRKLYVKSCVRFTRSTFEALCSVLLTYVLAVIQ